MKEINEKQGELLRTLQKRVKNLRTEWDSELGILRALEGKLAKGRVGEKPETVARRFVVRFSKLLGPRGTAQQYRIFKNVPARQGGRRISIQFVVDGLVVIDGFIVAYIDEELVLRKVRSSLPRNIAVTAELKISKKELVKILLKIFSSHPDAEDYLKRVQKRTHPFPLTSTPSLVIRRTENGFHPVWMGFAILPVDVELPTRRKEWILTQAEYFLDASNGKLLKAEATLEYADVSVPVQGYAVIKPAGSLVVVGTQGVQRDGAEYYLKNNDKDIEIITYDADGDGTNISDKLNNDTLDLSEDADGNWDQWTDSCDAATRKVSQQPEIDAHRFATQIYEFYETLGWKGFDNEGWGDGCPVRMVTHIGTSIGTGASCEKYDDTASGNKHCYLQFYDGGCEGGSIKYDFYAGELGTVAHEYQHAVTYFGVQKATGDPGGLYSDTIRGAMREGFSDSFAGFISGTWILRAPWPTGIGVNGPPLRRIEYPRSNDTSSNETYCDHYDDIGDETGKYFKSTVLSHIAFLVGQGGIHDRPSRNPQYVPIPPIGKERVAQIWHHALTDKFENLPAGSGDQRMINAGKYLLESADDLFGNRSKEYVLIRRALYAVGLYPFDTTIDPYVKQTYGGEACMFPWGHSWRRSQEYLSLPMFCMYRSIDLFIDNGAGPEYGANVGDENKVYARVRNIGDQDLSDVYVEFWYRKIGSALSPVERGWKRCKDINGVDCTLHVPNLLAGGMNFEDAYTQADAVNWYLDPAEITDEVDHFCLRAKIICDAPNHDNDYEECVMSNIEYVLVDPDSDTDVIIAFQTRNPDKEKEIPLDLEIEHTLPKGAVLRPLFDTKKVILKPREEKTVSYKLLVPRRALFPLRPPFDGELKGSIYGDICGPFEGNLSRVKFEKEQISATIAGIVGKIGTITGRFKGHLDRKEGIVEGYAFTIFSSVEGKCKHRELIIGIKAKLSPIRVVNFTQMIKGEATGGITAHLVLKKR